jgi:tetratricopeptide (TPR) repeat protein
MNKLHKYPTVLLLQIAFAAAAIVVAVVVMVEIKPMMEKTNQFEQRADSLSVLRDTVLVLRQMRENSRLASEYLSKGITLAEHGKRDEAINFYSRSIALDSSNPAAYDLRGYVFFKKKDYSLAVTDLERSVRIDSQYVWGHYNLALAYWHSGRQNEAVAEVKRVIAIDPGFKHVVRTDKQFSAFNTSAEFQKLIE